MRKLITQVLYRKLFVRQTFERKPYLGRKYTLRFNNRMLQNEKCLFL